MWVGKMVTMKVVVAAAEVGMVVVVKVRRTYVGDMFTQGRWMPLLQRVHEKKRRIDRPK